LRFSGWPLEVLTRKQSELPRPPLELGRDAPPDLASLCLRLLAVAPEKRAGLDEVTAALAAGAVPAPLRPPSTSQPITLAPPPFVGRARELQALDDAFAATRQGRSVGVIVRGESGVGKSSLVRRFADEAGKRGAVVLAGRCYERESVPYKALDGVLDALTNYM